MWIMASPISGKRAISLSFTLCEILCAVASGAVRRLIAGDATIQLIDVLVGTTLDRLAEAEHYAGKGEVILDEQAAAQLGDRAIVAEWRVDAATKQRFAVVSGLAAEVAPAPWPQVPPGARTGPPRSSRRVARW